MLTARGPGANALCVMSLHTLQNSLAQYFTRNVRHVSYLPNKLQPTTSLPVVCSSP